jgi:hypothetical protein
VLAERDARKVFRKVDSKKAMTEHEIAQKAFSNNPRASEGRTARKGGCGATTSEN